MHIQVISPFGSGYVQEHHCDETHSNLAWTKPSAPVANVNDAVTTMTSAMFDELLKSLRDALSLRHKR